MIALVAQLPLHMGPLHAYEKGLVFLLAFGPFVVLAVVVTLQRRRDARADDPGPERLTEAAPASPDRPGAPR